MSVSKLKAYYCYYYFNIWLLKLYNVLLKMIILYYIVFVINHVSIFLLWNTKEVSKICGLKKLLNEEHVIKVWLLFLTVINEIWLLQHTFYLLCIYTSVTWATNNTSKRPSYTILLFLYRQFANPSYLLHEF